MLFFLSLHFFIRIFFCRSFFPIKMTFSTFFFFLIRHVHCDQSYFDNLNNSWYVRIVTNTLYCAQTLWCVARYRSCRTRHFVMSFKNVGGFSQTSGGCVLSQQLSATWNCQRCSSSRGRKSLNQEPIHEDVNNSQRKRLQRRDEDKRVILLIIHIILRWVTGVENNEHQSGTSSKYLYNTKWT